VKEGHRKRGMNESETFSKINSELDLPCYDYTGQLSRPGCWTDWHRITAINMGKDKLLILEFSVIGVVHRHANVICCNGKILIETMC
jgi:hypothetical protein